MRRALSCARAAGQAGEVPVGAVLVGANGEVLAEGANAPLASHDPTAHAEIQALRVGAAVQENYRLPDTSLYVTLEPCAMCMGAIYQARVRRLVFGAPDPKTGAAGGRVRLQDAGFPHHLQVAGGVLAEECGELLREFFRARR